MKYIGIEYDKFGNKIQSDAETSQAFGERMKCFIDQYNNFTLVEADKDGEPVQVSVRSYVNFLHVVNNIFFFLSFQIKY